MPDIEVNNDTTIARGPGHSGELLSGTEFLEGLRHVVGFVVHPPAADPLALVVERIVKAPAVSQSRLLLRILIALVHTRGEFRRAEIAALDAATLALVIHLMDLRIAGTRSEREWADAAKAAEAASAW